MLVLAHTILTVYLKNQDLKLLYGQTNQKHNQLKLEYSALNIINCLRHQLKTAQSEKNKYFIN